MRILYYCPSSYGGLADYAHEQANAFAEMGIEVDFLCAPDYSINRACKYNLLTQLEKLEAKQSKSKGTRAGRIWRYVQITLKNYRMLGSTVEKGTYRYVLMGAYAEYLAPLWASQLRHLADQGVVFGAIIHDPVRDFVLGPTWWHRWSVAQGYAYLKHAFVHEPIALDTGQTHEQLITTVIPHGLYQFPSAQRSDLSVRRELNIPKQAKVVLSFGHIRDGKNLDLIIRAIAHLPNIYLVVAGKEQSSGQRPASYYQELAASLNVADRCRWQVGFISEETVADLFTATDVVALTYSQSFRSASGVLSVAANYQTQCLASGGEGSLKTTVAKYGLGTWVEPDSWEAIKDGLEQQLYHPHSARWKEYYTENSWLANAQIVVEALRTS